MQCLTLIFLHPSSFLKNLDVNSIWYHSEALELLYSSNQFLGLDFFFAVSCSGQLLMLIQDQFGSFRTFRLPLLSKLVSWWGLFLTLLTTRGLQVCVMFLCQRGNVFLFNKRQNTKRIYFVACRSALSQITQAETNQRHLFDRHTTYTSFISIYVCTLNVLQSSKKEYVFDYSHRCLLLFCHAIK